ncbi:Hpt domain-containing protein [Hyphomonas pacifica]|uniref:Uncharacterized protein n=1 Tax=Hyphomonas pacifica TaxID=1280941 RepID=A0A062TY80_9PROT|nr:Hpt domain-containing protein [Hyphomonas pacifica]KCZ53016.1 hypothetical protein HY2_00395 [Hyphomonas pacifica]RAN36125.1 hypothetical protein HY3_00675 [Hyphomonas pacifica]RAN37861.1 hypothetical protein HY11_08220 [Hyphomonas pacifica]
MTAPLALLDRNHLKSMTGNDPGLAIEIIELFQHQAEIWSRMLDPKTDPKQWADAAHTLKGSALGIGAIRLAAKCEKAEKAGRAETPPSLTAAAVLLGDVKDVLGNTLEEAAKTLHELESSGAFKAS